MDADRQGIETVDAYIAQFPPEIQEKLNGMRAAIREAAPRAVERISWQMPTYHQTHNLVHFAAHKHHVGFYPGADGMEAFADRLTEYKTTKGAVQFPYKRPIPFDLVREIVLYKVALYEKEAAEKKK